MAPSFLIVNPVAGGVRFVRGGEATWRLDAIRRALGKRNPGLELRLTRQPGEATTIAREAADAGAASVWALGGDGTLREAAAGLLGSPTPLGVLAGGTTNVLARSLGHETDPVSAIEAIYRNEKLRVRPLDVGLCTDRIGTELPFLMMMSRGLDARALYSLPAIQKRRFGRIAIAGRAIVEWLKRTEPTFEVSVEELGTGEDRLSASFLAASNISLYGGPFVLAPGASPFDGLLDLVGLTSEGRIATAVFGLGLVLGRPPAGANVWRRQARRMVMDGNGPAIVQLDGDGFELQLPIGIELATDRIALLTP